MNSSHSSDQTSTPTPGDDPHGRRRFIKLLAASAATLTVQACGGGGGGGSGGSTALPLLPGPIGDPNTPAPGNPDPTPVWTTVPDLSFTQGVAASISIAQYVSVPAGRTFTLALNSIALPPGVTFNAATRSFDYDGIGAIGSTDGHVLTATV